MDTVDMANALVDSDREALIELERARGKVPRVAPRHSLSGQRICVCCEEPLSHQRLAAVPHAVACTECESAEEHHRRGYRRRNPWAV